MTRRVRIEEVTLFLGDRDGELLAALRREGLFEADEVDAREAEELRVAASWIRELGVNAAGVSVALQLRRRLLALEGRVAELLRDALDEPDDGRD